MTWRIGMLTDRAGHVHLGAVVAGSAHRAREYIELVPIGAVPPAELDLEHLVVLVQGQHSEDLRRLVERCLDDRLRRRLAELIERSASPTRRVA